MITLIKKRKKKDNVFKIGKNFIFFLSYKNFNLLKKSLNNNCRIIPAKYINMKRYCQNKIKKYIKYSKYLGIMPYLPKINF